MRSSIGRIRIDSYRHLLEFVYNSYVIRMQFVSNSYKQFVNTSRNTIVHAIRIHNLYQIRIIIRIKSNNSYTILISCAAIRIKSYNTFSRIYTIEFVSIHIKAIR